MKIPFCLETRPKKIAISVKLFPKINPSEKKYNDNINTASLIIVGTAIKYLIK